jgi:hypothetical protein
MESHDRKKDEERRAAEDLLRKFPHVFGARTSEELHAEGSERPDWVLRGPDASIVGAIECARISTDMKEKEKWRRQDRWREGLVDGESLSDDGVREFVLKVIREKDQKAKEYRWPTPECPRVLLLSLNDPHLGMAFGEVSEVRTFGWRDEEVEQFDHVFVHDDPTGQVYPLPVRSRRGRT